MRILVINPNISESVTALIAAEARPRRAASPGTVILPATAPFGVAYIETESEAAIGAYAAMILYAEHGTDCDAVVIAAFGDPGLPAVREIAPVPVVGIAEAAFVAAGELGARFSIVAISERIAAWYRRCAQLNEVDGNLASIRTLTGPIGDIGSRPGGAGSGAALAVHPHHRPGRGGGDRHGRCAACRHRTPNCGSSADTAGRRRRQRRAPGRGQGPRRSAVTRGRWLCAATGEAAQGPPRGIGRVRRSSPNLLMRGHRIAPCPPRGRRRHRCPSHRGLSRAGRA